MKKSTLSFLFLFCFQISFAQLQGVYTVGNSSADFQTFQEFLDVLNISGVTGSVTLKIKDGIYESLNLSSYPGASADYPLVIESESQDSTKVIFTGGISFNLCSHYVLKGISILPTINNNSVSRLHFYYADNITVENCHIRDLDEVDYSWNQALVRITHYNTGIHKTCVIQNCDIQSFDRVLARQGDEGDYTFRNCKLSGSFDTEKGGEVIFDQNEIVIQSTSDYNFVIGIMSNNLISADATSGVECDEFIENTVLSELRLDCQKIMYNDFQVDPDLSSLDNSFWYGNFFRNGLDLFATDNSRFMANHFWGMTRIHGDYNEIFNNLIYDTLWVYSGWQPEIQGNNFAAGALLKLGSTNGSIKSNNLSNIEFYPYNQIFEKNNYFPTDSNHIAAAIDTEPYFYTPNYVDNEWDLHATNPLLSKKGVKKNNVWYYANDIDGIFRPNQPAIGANELCITDLPDTLNILCADFAAFPICQNGLVDGLHWSPEHLFDDPFSINPILEPDSSHMIYLKDSLDNVLDSSFVSIISHSSLPTQNYERDCGLTGPVFALAPAGASVAWTPTEGLEDPFSSFTTANLSDSITYVAHIDLGECGTKVDTFHYFVDPNPVAVAYNLGHQNGIYHFGNLSRCAEEYLWKFGDGDTSTLAEPTHAFPFIGVYPVTLIASNHHGKDTTFFFHSVTTLNSTNDISPYLKDIALFPTPTSNILNLDLKNYPLEVFQLQILDINGKVLIQKEIQGGNIFSTEISEFPFGNYTVILKHKSGVWTERFLKVN